MMLLPSDWIVSVSSVFAPWVSSIFKSLLANDTVVVGG